LPAAQALAIANFKQRLPGWLPPHVQSDAERRQVFSDATSITGQTLLPGAKVSATGAFQLTARTNSILTASVTTVAPMVVNIDIAYGKSQSAATATIGAGATVNAVSATVSADAINDLNTSAGGYNLSLGKKIPFSGGLGVAVSNYS